MEDKMKLAIISDTHFGDPECSLVPLDPKTNKYILGTKKYDDFRNAAGINNDYLILLGDIFDFSIASYQEAYAASKEFFKQIASDNICKEIIYVPGNHDFSAWHTLMHEINFINRIKKCKEVAEQRWSCPAVLKDGDNPNDWLTLPFVSQQEQPRQSKYGEIYLEGLTKTHEDDSPIPFNVAYPNIYMITEQGEGVLFTHGHYFETFWCFAGEFSKEIAMEDLVLEMENFLKSVNPGFTEYTSVNFPLNVLASLGVAHAAPLTNIVRAIQKEVRNHKLDRVEKYLTRTRSYLDNHVRFGKGIKGRVSEAFSDMVLKRICVWILGELNKQESSRDDSQFLERNDVNERFKRYYIASAREKDSLNEDNINNFNIPNLTIAIFGHCHVPTLYETPHPHSLIKIASNDSDDSVVKRHITGGWLWKPGSHQEGKVNAAVYAYESKAGFRSQIV